MLDKSKVIILQTMACITTLHWEKGVTLIKPKLIPKLRLRLIGEKVEVGD